MYNIVRITLPLILHPHITGQCCLSKLNLIGAAWVARVDATCPHDGRLAASEPCAMDGRYMRGMRMNIVTVLTHRS